MRLIVLMMALGLAVAPASAEATTLTWSSPFSITSQIPSISCPSASLCVAVAGGDVITSNDPAGGASAWSSVSVDTSASFTTVSCVPGGTFCVALDAKDAVWTSNDPTGGATAWTNQGTIVNTFDVPARVSCPSTSLCVAVDVNGAGARSSDPGGPASTWSVNAISSNGATGELSCASTSLCIAVDTDDFLYSSTNPAAGAWSKTNLSSVNGGSSLNGASCAPGTSTCVVGGGCCADNLMTSTDPTGGVSAWTVASIDNFALVSLSCADVSFCAGGGSGGNVVQSSDPLGGGGTWTLSHVDGSDMPTVSNAIVAISCPDERLCVAVDQGGNAIVGTVASDALSVTKSGAGSGTVTSSPAGINCGTNCSASFDRGTTVTLTAAPAAGSTFSGWSGGGCRGTGACQITMNGNTTVSATFAVTPKGQHALTLVKAGNGSGTVTSIPSGISCGTLCSANFADGQLVTLIPNPAAGSQFAGWSGACHGAGGCQLFLATNATVTATFTKVKHALTVQLSGNGTGTVTTRPTGLNCGPTCTTPFDHGTTVTLFPNPKPGSAFGGWSGAGCFGLATCRVTMNADKSLFASFFPSPISVTGNSTTQEIDCTRFGGCYIVLNLDDCLPPHACIGAQLAGDVASANAAPPRVLGHAVARIPAHERRAVHIKLTAAAKRYLRKHHRLKVTEFIITKVRARRTVTERTFTLVFH